MTAQIHDTVHLDEIEWAIVGIDGVGLFDPSAYAIVPGPMSTGCYRGFICSYEVTGDGALHLIRLTLSPAARVDGEEISASTTLLGAPAQPDSRGHELSFEVRVPVAFSGGLLLATEWGAARGVNMGFQPGWRFGTVVELRFDEGRVLGRQDHSQRMAALRAAIDEGSAPDPDGERGSEGWVERTFTLDYSRSFGTAGPTESN